MCYPNYWRENYLYTVFPIEGVWDKDFNTFQDKIMHQKFHSRVVLGFQFERVLKCKEILAKW
jgi:hypothetical protein